ncbi:hypothetical protein [Haloferula sargassicola]|uniref:Uncharacterized protein n=1 Tax=Haloferula sargassicola TaxID=490096 RepID=A0ABP9UVD7_9BACT
MKKPALPGLTAAFLLATLSSLSAQSTRQVAFRTLCLQYVDDLKSALAPVKKADAAEVRLFTGGFSPVYTGQFQGGTAALFVDDPSAKEGKRPIAQGKLGSSDRQLFLILPDPQKKLPYRIYCMDDDTASFPMGTVRFLNLAPYEARLELAGAKMPEVKPGGSKTYPRVTAIDEWKMYQARIEFKKPDGSWATISSPSWKSSVRKRDLVIPTIDPATKRPKIYNYQDIPPWLEAPPEE